MSKIASVAPGGECPLWLAFLDRITAGNSELQLYHQRVCGLCLTGVTTEHVLFFFYGTGANGKTVYCNTILGIIGGYGQTASMDSFTESKDLKHPTDLAAMRGARLLVATETESGRRWAESRIKMLTGGDTVRARFMHCDEFEYVPQFKLIISGNHRPGLRSVNEAIRRRIHLVPFTVVIPPEERDPDLTEKLRAEWSGILAWAIEGCRQWQLQGLNPPTIVNDATNAYLAGEDRLGRWLEDRAIVDKRYSTKSSALYADFKVWCEQTGERTPSQKRFSQELLDRGFVNSHLRTGWIIEGVGLRSDLQL
jgi:putative DNA primase/helicase